jgi:hypothetical protein
LALPNNFDKLKAAGLILNECPEAHQEVLNSLSEDEMQVIMDVRDRLAEADAAVGAEQRPAFTNCIAF